MAKKLVFSIRHFVCQLLWSFIPSMCPQSAPHTHFCFTAATTTHTSVHTQCWTFVVFLVFVCKIRVTKADWVHIKTMQDEFFKQNHHDTNFILQKLLADGAFYFCAASEEVKDNGRAAVLFCIIPNSVIDNDNN